VDEQIRKLEREALAGNPQATESLLWEQRRQGMWVKKHYILGTGTALVRPSNHYVRSYEDVRLTTPYNFELHRVTAHSTGEFWLEIQDALGHWSDRPIHSNNFTKVPYQLLEPRLLPKNTQITLRLENSIGTNNMILIDFHGIITEVNNGNS